MLAHHRRSRSEHEITRQSLRVHLTEEAANIDRPPKLARELTVERVVEMIDVIAPRAMVIA
jgi:hypothetical protein